MDSALQKVYHGGTHDMQRFVILHNIRSAHNVGSIFRTADGAGVSKIYLTGYTPCPVDRFGREQPEIKKTSLGATESVLWEHRDSVEDLIGELKRGGTTVVAVEQTETSTNYIEEKLEGDRAYIFGNETDGIEENVLQKADEVVEIPMQGKKESLNVSVVAGIILFNTQ